MLTHPRNYDSKAWQHNNKVVELSVYPGEKNFQNLTLHKTQTKLSYGDPWKRISLDWTLVFIFFAVIFHDNFFTFEFWSPCPARKLCRKTSINFSRRFQSPSSYMFFSNQMMNFPIFKSKQNFCMSCLYWSLSRAEWQTVWCNQALTRVDRNLSATLLDYVTSLVHLWFQNINKCFFAHGFTAHRRIVPWYWACW